MAVYIRELSRFDRSFSRMNNTLVVTAVVHQEDQWFVADCPELGTVSQGLTFDEAVDNLREATDLYIAEFGRRI